MDWPHLPGGQDAAPAALRASAGGQHGKGGALGRRGTLDPVISVELGRDARDRAQAAGADVVYRETEVPHIVDPRIIPGLVDWLDKRF